MRIKFLEHVPVELDQVPKDARGAIAIRHESRRPRFVPSAGVSTVERPEPARRHYWRKGWSAELPDAMARAYIAAGQAAQVASVVRMHADDFTRFNGLYSAEHEQMFLAGVILGYTPGSTPQSYQFERGPNWDKWQAALPAPAQTADDEDPDL